MVFEDELQEDPGSTASPVSPPLLESPQVYTRPCSFSCRARSPPLVSHAPKSSVRTALPRAQGICLCHPPAREELREVLLSTYHLSGPGFSLKEQEGCQGGPRRHSEAALCLETIMNIFKWHLYNTKTNYLFNRRKTSQPCS